MNKTIVASMTPLDVCCIHINDTYAGCHFYIKNTDTNKRVGGRHDTIGEALEACIDYFRHSQDAIPSYICVAMPTLISVQNQVFADGVRARLNQIEEERKQHKPLATDALPFWMRDMNADRVRRCIEADEREKAEEEKPVVEEKPVPEPAVREVIPVEFEISGQSAYRLMQMFRDSDNGKRSLQRDKLFELVVEKMHCEWSYGNDQSSTVTTIKGTLCVPKGAE